MHAKYFPPNQHKVFKSRDDIRAINNAPNVNTQPISGMGDKRTSLVVNDIFPVFSRFGRPRGALFHMGRSKSSHFLSVFSPLRVRYTNLYPGRSRSSRQLYNHTLLTVILSITRQFDKECTRDLLFRFILHSLQWQNIRIKRKRKNKSLSPSTIKISQYRCPSLKI